MGHKVLVTVSLQSNVMLHHRSLSSTTVKHFSTCELFLLNLSLSSFLSLKSVWVWGGGVPAVRNCRFYDAWQVSPPQGRVRSKPGWVKAKVETMRSTFLPSKAPMFPNATAKPDRTSTPSSETQLDSVPAWRPPVASVCAYVIVQNATAHRRQVLLNASVKVGAVLIWWNVLIGFWGSCSDNFTGFKDSGAVFFSWCLLWFVIDGWMWTELQQWCNSCCLKTKRGCFCFPARIPAKELIEILWRCVGISINIRYFVFPFIKVD